MKGPFLTARLKPSCELTSGRIDPAISSAGTISILTGARSRLVTPILLPKNKPSSNLSSPARSGQRKKLLGGSFTPGKTSTAIVITFSSGSKSILAAHRDEIQPADPAILDSPELFSGVNYGLIEFIAMLPLLSKWLHNRMPADSHAKNNMDDPEANPLFPYAITAATKRTRLLWQDILDDFQKNQIPQPLISQFTGGETDK